MLLLQVHGHMTARELARRLEVSERTVLRDMDALDAAGIPVRAERGASGGWRLVDGYQTKLTGLTPAEIQSLFVSHPPQLLADLGLARSSESAWNKLHAALPASARPQAGLVRRRILIDSRGWRDPSETLGALPTLIDALWRQRRVRFHYENVLHEAGDRRVDPLGLVARGAAWYLVALRRGETRIYRVSRMREAEIVDEASSALEDFDLAAYWEKSAAEFREALPRYEATYLASPSVMRWARYRGRRLEEQTPDGDRVRIRLVFDAEEEALQFALSFGADIEAIDPPGLRDKVLEAAERTARHYRNSARPNAEHGTAPLAAESASVNQDKTR